MSPGRRLASRVGVAAVLLGVGGACASDAGVSPAAEFRVSFSVSNNLIAPVTISIDGSPYVSMQGLSSMRLTISSTAQWLTWTSAKPMDSDGHPIPDDIGDVTIAPAGINGVLDISNVIRDQTYITARIFNTTNVPVSIGVFDGASVSCASQLPATSGVVSGFTLIGYYKLLPATEIRAYRDPSGCTGPYTSWPKSELKGFSGKSGLLTLFLDSPP